MLIGNVGISNMFIGDLSVDKVSYVLFITMTHIVSMLVSVFLVVSACAKRMKHSKRKVQKISYQIISYAFVNTGKKK